MKTVYLFKALIYFSIGLYYGEIPQALASFSFLAVVMFFFWLDLTIKGYIDELKDKIQ